MTDDEPLGDIADEIRDRTGDERPETGEERAETRGQRREGSPDSEVADPKHREGPLADVAAAVDERRRRKRTDSGDPFESVDVGELDGEKLWAELAERDDGDDSGDETTDAGTTATDTATTGTATTDAATTDTAAGTATADSASVTSPSGNSSSESTGLVDEDVMDDWPEDDSADEWDDDEWDDDEWEDDEWDDGQDVRTIPKETCQGCPHVGDPPELHCTHEGTEILSMPDTDHFRVVDCPMAVDDEDLDLEIGPDE